MDQKSAWFDGHRACHNTFADIASMIEPCAPTTVDPWAGFAHTLTAPPATIPQAASPTSSTGRTTRIYVPKTGYMALQAR